MAPPTSVQIEPGNIASGIALPAKSAIILMEPIGSISRDGVQKLLHSAALRADRTAADLISDDTSVSLIDEFQLGNEP